jgi:Flp pilus assembly protein TadG
MEAVMPYPLSPRQRGERGQSLVEFALFSVFLATLLLGVADLARMYFTYLALKDAAGEGAYFGAAFPDCVDDQTSLPGCTNPDNIKYRVINTSPAGGMVNWSAATVTTTLPAVIEPGEVLTVAVTADYQLLTPVIGAIVNNNRLTLSAQSVAVIIRVPNCSHSSGCQ